MLSLSGIIQSKIMAVFAALVMLPLTGCSKTPTVDSLAEALAGLPAGDYCVIETSHTSKDGESTIVFEVFAESKAQIAIRSIVGLANGTQPFYDPRSKMRTTRPYYDGLIFHRTVGNELIQGGDIFGTGGGSPGYTYASEPDPAHSFREIGTIGMANSGPEQNGSQFFILLMPYPHLDPNFSAVGKVVKGLELAQEISTAPTNRFRTSDTPLDPVKIRMMRVYTLSADGNWKLKEVEPLAEPDIKLVEPTETPVE